MPPELASFHANDPYQFVIPRSAATRDLQSLSRARNLQIPHFVGMTSWKMSV